MVIPILTLILGIIGGAAADRYLQRRRRGRKALEEIETVLFQIQKYCWKLNGEIIVTNPETYPYELTEMTTEEARGIMRRLSAATENLERRAFEATRILRSSCRIRSEAPISPRRWFRSSIVWAVLRTVSARIIASEERERMMNALTTRERL